MSGSTPLWTGRRLAGLCLAVAVTVWLAGAPGAGAQPAGITEGERAAWAFAPDVVGVTVTGTDADGSATEYGFGFVAGERNGNLLVVTADHVLRLSSGAARGSVSVKFYSDRSEPRAGRLLDLRLGLDAGDLGVLEVPKPPGFRTVPIAMVSSYGLALGARAWRIGKQQRWVPASEPGSFVGRHGALWLEFDHLDTPAGSSGGPVVNEQGLVGMVVQDGGLAGTPARVLPAETIGAVLREWQLPWQFEPASMQEEARPAPAPAPRPTPEAAFAARPGPVPTVPAQADLRQRAMQAAIDYHVKWSGPNDALNAYLADLYADSVSFYGKVVSRPVILGLKHDYLLRWPLRRYTVRPSTLTATCDWAGTCTTDGEVDWDVSSPERHAHSAGSANFEFQISFFGSRPLIVGETGSVISRQTP